MALLQRPGPSIPSIWMLIDSPILARRSAQLLATPCLHMRGSVMKDVVQRALSPQEFRGMSNGFRGGTPHQHEQLQTFLSTHQFLGPPPSDIPHTAKAKARCTPPLREVHDERPLHFKSSGDVPDVFNLSHRELSKILVSQKGTRTASLNGPTGRPPKRTSSRTTSPHSETPIFGTWGLGFRVGV